jgi:transcriptional regulator with XRE-family HTH domain
MTNAVNLSDLGRRVRAARLARRLTLEEVVSRANFTVSWLSKLENGQLTPSLDGLVRLAEVLECGVDTLVQGLSVPPQYVVVKQGEGRSEPSRDSRNGYVTESLADQWRDRAMNPAIARSTATICTCGGSESVTGAKFTIPSMPAATSRSAASWACSAGTTIMPRRIPEDFTTSGRSSSVLNADALDRLAHLRRVGVEGRVDREVLPAEAAVAEQRLAEVAHADHHHRPRLVRAEDVPHRPDQFVAAVADARGSRTVRRSRGLCGPGHR